MEQPKCARTTLRSHIKISTPSSYVRCACMQCDSYVLINIASIMDKVTDIAWIQNGIFTLRQREPSTLLAQRTLGFKFMWSDHLMYIENY